ncbi:MAG TPA: PAS domain-containing protein [Burkholderiales bacterium]
MSALERVDFQAERPALARLLSESALYRAALGALGFPLAILEAAHPARPVRYVNPAFEEFFGLAGREALGRPLAELVLRGDEPLAHRLLAGSRAHWQINVWTRAGAARRVETTVGAVRDAQERITHWVVAFAPTPTLP